MNYLKQKLLLTVAALLGGVISVSAQTDVTSTYLPNADFEGSYTSLTTVTNVALDSRSIQDPADWEIAFGGTFHKWDSSVLSSSDATYSSNISKRITIPSSGFGNQTYAFRCQGSKTGEILRLYQTPTLPRGRYTLSAKLHTQHKDNMEASIYVEYYSSGRIKADKNCTKDEWVEKSKSFDITESKTVELGVYFSHNTASDYTAGVDNVKLSYSNYTTELSSMIARAEALSNASLASAINTAQSVLNAADNTVAYQTDIDNAVTTLQAAIIAAQNTNGSALTAAVKNPGFEGAQMWYIKTTGADTYHADAWTNSSPFTSGVYHYSTTTTDQKSEGSQSYKVRFNWADASCELSQRIPGLSLGRYVITADVKATNGSYSSIEAYIKGNSTKGESVTAATSGFQTISATVDLNEAGNLDVILGMDYDYTGNGSSGSEAIMYWDNITLTYYSPVDLYNSTKSDAQDTYDNSEYGNVTGLEKTTLYNLLNPSPAPSTVADYFQAIDDINVAVAAFTAAKTNYDKYAEEKARAIAMGVASGDITAMTLASQYTTRLQELIVLEDAAVTTGYPEDATEVVGEWTKQNTSTADTEHWSGTTQTYYNKWDQWGFTMSLSKTVSLPAGRYVLKAAARCLSVNNENNFYLGVTPSGSDLIKEIYTSTGGSTGLGIDKTGAANYTAVDDTYAHDNNGYGWEWRFVRFELDETTEVELKITANILGEGWVSFSDVTLLTTSDNIDVFEQIYNTAKTAATTARDNATYANVDGSEKKALTDAINEAVPETPTLAWYQTQASTLKSATATFTSNDVKTAYNNLATAISNANGIVTASTNVGTGVFQVPISIRTTLSEAASTASATKSNTSTTYSDASTAATILNTAISTYNTDFAAAELNAPTEGQRIRIVNCTASSAFDFSGKALTFYANPEQLEGGYGYQYRLDPNDAYAQNFIFTPVAGQKNQYTMSFIDNDGTTRYVCTQYGYNENASGDKNRIRTTTNSEYALKVRVDVTTTANVWKLYNTEAGKNIGTNGKSNSDFFSNNDRSDLTLSAASQASVAVSCKAGKYGTVIFPFTPDVSSGFDGITFYSTSEVNPETNRVQLVEVSTPVANVPYLIYNTSGNDLDLSEEPLRGWGTAAADSYTAGLLKGVFVDEAIIPASTETIINYVLQTKPVDAQAFYKVTSAFTTTPYKCYLTVNSEITNAHMLKLFFDEDETTGINGLTPNPSPESEGSKIIYDLQGRKVQNPKRGMYIINGKKVVVK